MDIFAHGLWTGVGAAFLKKRVKKKPLNVRLATFFGMFPDLFAFALLPFWIVLNLLERDITLPEVPRDLPSLFDIEPAPPDTFWIFRLTSVLYGLSHSAIMFALVFGIVLLMKRRIVWEMFGWLFHIVVDVFTHSYSFYPTPVLWPISVWHFDGLAWHTPWFMVLNYAALALMYLMIVRRWRRRKVLDGEPRPISSLLRRNINFKLMVKKFVGRQPSRMEGT